MVLDGCSEATGCGVCSSEFDGELLPSIKGRSDPALSYKGSCMEISVSRSGRACVVEAGAATSSKQSARADGWFVFSVRGEVRLIHSFEDK